METGSKASPSRRAGICVPNGEHQKIVTPTNKEEGDKERDQGAFFAPGPDFPAEDIGAHAETLFKREALTTLVA